jgi:hypothetical protein
MKNKILIIGAGWYGCHLGLFLKKNNDVLIFEKEKDIFLGSSGYNQFRLHNGYHYPRSASTISEVKKNYIKFTKRYKNFISFPENNIYAIAKKKSLIDFQTYINILTINKLRFKKKKFNFLKNIEGSIISDEGVILNDKVKKFFKKNLQDNIHYKKKVHNIKRYKKNFDWIIDCTNNTLKNNYLNEIEYILTISFIYKVKNNQKVYPLTVMDGELPSIYPYSDKKDYFTLTHAKYTHIKRFNKYENLINFKKKINPKIINKNKKLSEKSIINFYKDFKKKFLYKGYFLSYKIIPKEVSAKRATYITKNRNLLTVFSPKISNIFTAENYIKKIIK